jgi:hypothetical protein
MGLDAVFGLPRMMDKVRSGHNGYRSLADKPL